MWPFALICPFVWRLKKQKRVPVVITCHPSTDHSYSLTNLPDNPGSPGSSIDEEYEFGSDSFSETSAESDFNDDDDLADEGSDEEVLQPAAKQRRLVGRPSTRRGTETDEDEHQKIVDGADALLNLAGIKTPLSSSSSSLGTLRVASPLLNNNSIKPDDEWAGTSNSSRETTETKPFMVSTLSCESWLSY